MVVGCVIGLHHITGPPFEVQTSSSCTLLQLHSELAVRHGARMVSSERVVSWRSLSPSGGGGGVEVTTSSGARHTAGQMIVAAGAWMGQMVPETKVGPWGRRGGGEAECFIGPSCIHVSLRLMLKHSQRSPLFLPFPCSPPCP